MKKYLTLLLSVVMIFQCVVFANAALYDKDSRYTIDLPEKFHQIGENKFITSDNSNFSVSFDDNTEEKFCVSDLNDKSVKEYTDKLVAESKNVFDSLGINASVKVVSAEKIEHQNGKDALVMILETNSVKDGKKSVGYEKIYVFSGEENIFTFTYTAGKKEQLSDLDDAFDSIVVNESEVESKLDKLTSVAIYSVIIIVMLLVVVWFVKRRSR